MSNELTTLIDESLALRQQVQALQEQYDARRQRIFQIMSDSGRKFFQHGNCKVFRTEPVSFESVSKDLLVKALKEVDIPREKKVFIWNHAVKEVLRPGMVTLSVQHETKDIPVPASH